MQFLKNNIGVYRFDERGVGKSEGKFTKSIDHLSYDLAYAIMHLKSLLKLQEKKMNWQARYLTQCVWQSIVVLNLTWNGS